MHTKTCITKCLVFVSVIWDSGLWRLSITKLQSSRKFSFRPRVTSYKASSTLKKALLNSNKHLDTYS